MAPAKVVHAPKQFSRGGIEAREDAPNAQGDDLAIRDRGCAARAGEVGGRAIGPERIVFVLPKFLARRDVEAAENLLPLLAGEDVELVAHEGGRGHAVTDGDFPFLRQFLGPDVGNCEASGFGIPVGPAPLRPILRPRFIHDYCQHTHGDN